MGLTEQIIAEFAREQQSERGAGTVGGLPLSYETMTADWLTQVLCAGIADAQVTQLRLDAEDEGTTNRRRIFLSYNLEGQQAGLPATIFCKATQKLSNRLSQANVGTIEGEVTFYRKYRQLLDIEAPCCRYAEFDPRSYNSIVMLDDLVAAGARFCTHETDVTRGQAESQLALLAKLHGTFNDSLELHASELITFENFFRNVDGWFGLADCCDNGFMAAEPVIPERLFRRKAKIWPATLASVEIHERQPRTFTHVDPHLRNWYAAAEDRMGLSDWQTLSKGHWARDVAYTMSTSLSVANRRAWERELLQFYLEELEAAGGASVAFDDAWRFYRQHMFSALAWWTLTLAPSTGDADEPVPELQPRAACLLFIERMTTAIDDLDALDSFR